MSYPLQPQFPNMDAPTRSQPTYTPSKPVQPQQAPQAWQPQAAPNDFAFYSPPQPQSVPMQPMQPQQPYGMHPQQPQQQQQQAEGWGSDSGAHMRGGQMGQMGSMGVMGPGQQQPPAFMPAAASQLMNNPMSSMAFDYGKASFAKNLSWVMSWLVSLKYYFHVNNAYVMRKIKIILVPFLHANWKREKMDNGGGGGGAGGGAASAAPLLVSPGDDGQPTAYRPPRDDVNAPDLYIPTMAFVTFVLSMGYALGTAGQFHPEVLGITASRSMVLLFFEVLGLKLGLYLIAVGPSSAQAPPTSLLDLVAYASYKYVHCILMIVLGLLGGSLVFYGSIVVLGALAALFMMRTMKRVCTAGIGGPSGLGGDASSPHANNGSFAMQSSYGQGKHRRNYFLLIVGALQIVFSWFIVRTANQGF